MNHRELKNQDITDFVNKVMETVAEAFTEGNFHTRDYVSLACALRSNLGFTAMQTLSDETQPEMAKKVRQSIFDYLVKSDHEALRIELEALNSTQR